MINCVELFKDICVNNKATSESTGYEWCVYTLRVMGINNKYFVKLITKTIIAVQFVIVLLSLIIVFFKLLKVLMIHNNSKTPVVLKENSTFFLLFTPLFLSRLTKTDISERVTDPRWIVGPNIKGKVEVPEGADVLELESAVNGIDIIKSFVETLKICCIYLIKARAVIPVYRYFDFCMVSKGLEKLTGGSDLFFSNQCDRWALLFDRLPAKSKTILQHGIDTDYHGKLVKLQNIDTFYAISKGSWQMSYAHLLACKPELRIMNPTIELTEMDTDKVSVLIISHIIYIDIEKQILEAIKDMPIKVFLKKHPTVVNDAAYRELESQYGFTYITNKTFPKVDYVISYESTLVYEYMNFDIPIFTYNPEGVIDYIKIREGIENIVKSSNHQKRFRLRVE